jgi:hypothetical protein
VGFSSVPSDVRIVPAIRPQFLSYSSLVTQPCVYREWHRSSTAVEDFLHIIAYYLKTNCFNWWPLWWVQFRFPMDTCRKVIIPLTHVISDSRYK